MSYEKGPGLGIVIHGSGNGSGASGQYSGFVPVSIDAPGSGSLETEAPSATPSSASPLAPSASLPGHGCSTRSRNTSRPAATISHR